MKAAKMVKIMTKLLFEFSKSSFALGSLGDIVEIDRSELTSVEEISMALAVKVLLARVSENSELLSSFV